MGIQRCRRRRRSSGSELAVFGPSLPFGTGRSTLSVCHLSSLTIALSPPKRRLITARYDPSMEPETEHLRVTEVIPPEPTFDEVLAEWGRCRACGGPDDHSEQCVHVGFKLPVHETTARDHDGRLSGIQHPPARPEEMVALNPGELLDAFADFLNR